MHKFIGGMGGADIGKGLISVTGFVTGFET